MLKYIGAGVALFGLVLLASTLILGRRNRIRQAKDELAMITGAGYASDHVAEKKERSPFEQQFATRIKKRRRQLDEESKSIFEAVEKDRAEKNMTYAEQSSQPRIQKIRKGTDILPRVQKETSEAGRSVKKGTAVLEEAPSGKKSTDIPQKTPEKKKGTDALMPKPYSTDVLRPERRGTDVLPDNASQGRKEKQAVGKGTDVLSESPRKGTDILLGNMMAEEDGSGPPKRKKGTDVLPFTKKGTDILVQSEEQASPAKKGTDVLQDFEIPGPSKEGADAL